MSFTHNVKSSGSLIANVGDWVNIPGHDEMPFEQSEEGATIKLCWPMGKLKVNSLEIDCAWDHQSLKVAAHSKSKKFAFIMPLFPSPILPEKTVVTAKKPLLREHYLDIRLKKADPDIKWEDFLHGNLNIVRKYNSDIKFKDVIDGHYAKSTPISI